MAWPYAMLFTGALMVTAYAIGWSVGWLLHRAYRLIVRR